MTAANDIASLQDIRDLLKVLPAADEEAAAIARERQAQLTKPAGSLGRLEDLAVWLAPEIRPPWIGPTRPSLPATTVSRARASRPILRK